MGKSSNRDYTIPIKGLSVGRHNFSFTVDRAFFEEFGNSDIMDASLAVDVVLEREIAWMRIGSEIKGEVGVECDRCLEEVMLPLETKASLLVKFTRSEGETDDEEVLTLDSGESELDLKQFFYDYICLALPLQKVHKEGGCDPEMIARLKSAGEIKKSKGENNSPFDKLKDLLN